MSPGSVVVPYIELGPTEFFLHSLTPAVGLSFYLPSKKVEDQNAQASRKALETIAAQLSDLNSKIPKPEVTTTNKSTTQSQQEESALATRKPTKKTAKKTTAKTTAKKTAAKKTAAKNTSSAKLVISDADTVRRRQGIYQALLSELLAFKGDPTAIKIGESAPLVVRIHKTIAPHIAWSGTVPDLEGDWQPTLLEVNAMLTERKVQPLTLDELQSLALLMRGTAFRSLAPYWSSEIASAVDDSSFLIW